VAFVVTLACFEARIWRLFVLAFRRLCVNLLVQRASKCDRNTLQCIKSNEILMFYMLIMCRKEAEALQRRISSVGQGKTIFFVLSQSHCATTNNGNNENRDAAGGSSDAPAAAAAAAAGAATGADRTQREVSGIGAGVGSEEKAAEEEARLNSALDKRLAGTTAQRRMKLAEKQEEMVAALEKQGGTPRFDLDTYRSQLVAEYAPLHCHHHHHRCRCRCLTDLFVGLMMCASSQSFM
jgi:hypothetical protein